MKFVNTTNPYFKIIIVIAFSYAAFKVYLAKNTRTIDIILAVGVLVFVWILRVIEWRQNR